MHFSLPAVVSDVRGNSDLIDENGGILTSPNDIEGQVKALNKLLDDETLREKQGAYNKEKIKDYYLENVRGELKKIYQENSLI